MEPSKKVRPRALAAAEAKRRERQEKLDNALDEGDPVSWGSTIEVKHKGASIWVKMEAGSKVRPGETGTEAAARVTEFVVEHLDTQRDEIVSS